MEYSINYKVMVRKENGLKIVMYRKVDNVIYLKQMIFQRKESGPAEIIQLKEKSYANKK